MLDNRSIFKSASNGILILNNLAHVKYCKHVKRGLQTEIEKAEQLFQFLMNHCFEMPELN